MSVKPALSACIRSTLESGTQLALDQQIPNVHLAIIVIPSEKIIWAPEPYFLTVVEQSLGTHVIPDVLAHLH